MGNSLNIDSIESLYKALNDRDEIKVKALLMLMLRSWLTEVSNFDPVSGHALHTGIVDFMNIVAKSMQFESSECEIKDRIYRIVAHTKEAVLAIMEHTRDKILREHAMLPIHAAREVDSKSVQWLSRQPGRTLREKLSGKPYIKAVRRRSSVDTAENRLLRAFLFRMEQILIERQNSLSTATEETCEELLVSLQRWLRSEDASEIGAWGNLPPNNTLLQDKRYRKVWDGWLWLQAIDEHIIGDSKRFHRDILSVIYWNTLSLLNHSGRFRTAQQPVGFDFDSFSISPELPVRGYLFPENLSTPPKQIDIELQNEQINIRLDGKAVSILIDGDQVVLAQRNKSVKKKIKIQSAALKEIPKTILSLVMDSPFEYSEPTNNQCAPIRIDSSVVDLCSIRPTFTNNTGSQAHLPFRLLQQIWTLKDGMKQVVDCGSAKAITLSEGIESISMRRIFSHSSTLPDAIKSSASMFFTKKLSDYITADKLTYLVPDWGNDFDLEGIRKSINFYFDESTPLPKSIAATFAWQSSIGFKEFKINNNTEILIIDSFYGGFSVTPLTVRYNKELKQQLSQTMGVSWERHPTFLIENNRILKEVVDKLEVAKCPFPEEVVQLFGLDGLYQEAGKLTIEHESAPFHLPNNINDVLCINHSFRTSSKSDELKKYLNGRNPKNIFVLPMSQSIVIDPLLEGFKELSVNGGISLTEGAQFLGKWQREVVELDIALWRDHLPELSIRIVRDGHFENFYLVKDATVTPQRGRTVNIPVEESFTLPAGQTHYSFPLQQGEGNKKLQFVAYLKSPAFPLKEATACRLKMTYTYGADDPYELKFIPLDSAEAGFKSIRVDWRSSAEKENKPPKFPPRKSWSDFQKFPKEDDKSFSDLLDWVKRDMKKISDIAHYGRVSGTIPKWIDKGNSNVFCFIDDVFIHKSLLRLSSEQELPQPGDILSFYKIEGDHGKFSAEDVVIGNSQPTRCFLARSLRFPALTIWNHGHSLSESDVPDHFRSAILEGSKKIISIIESKNMPDTLKEELFFFLCCLHKDAPGILSTKLLEAAQNGQLLKKNNKNIAFAIGDAELPWQQQLLSSVISPIDNEGLMRSITLEDLAIALWRSEALVFKLSETELRKLCNDLFRCIQFDMQLLTSDIPEHRLQFHLEKGLTETEAQKRERGYQTNTLCKHLELLLALLRSRGNEDENFKMILAPDKDLTQKYVVLVDDVSRIVIDGDIELKSRISLQIEKPEMFCNTPDLLYALRMYLTGDSGANTIVITGVSDED